MTNYELIQKLLKFPMDMEVYVPSKTGDYEFGKVYSAHAYEITLQNDEEIDAIVIDES